MPESIRDGKNSRPPKDAHLTEDESGLVPGVRINSIVWSLFDLNVVAADQKRPLNRAAIQYRLQVEIGR